LDEVLKAAGVDVPDVGPSMGLQKASGPYDVAPRLAALCKVVPKNDTSSITALARMDYEEKYEFGWSPLVPNAWGLGSWGVEGGSRGTGEWTVGPCSTVCNSHYPQDHQPRTTTHE